MLDVGHSLQGRLTTLSKFWFTLLTTKIPDIQTHYVSLGVPQSLHGKLLGSLAAQLQRSSMVVRRLKVLPIESIVRGYITGSAWSSYQKDGTVCGIELPKGLRESEKLEKPLWTPSTKAAAGEKDENISPREGTYSLKVPSNRVTTGKPYPWLTFEAANIIGKEYALQVETLSLRIYEAASDYARSQGIILADTKFEFGLDETTSPPSVVLIDEVLTPDSSRFWSVEKYEVGKPQESFDKQLLRDWLVRRAEREGRGRATT